MELKYNDQTTWERAPGYVYFMAAGDPPVAIKIGISVQAGLRKRMRSIQSANHMPIRLLGVIPFEGMERPMVAAGLRERELHERFAVLQRFEDRWVGSEWFSVSPELMSCIAETCQLPTARNLLPSIFRPGPGLQA